MTGWNPHHEWRFRCISYWKWVDFPGVMPPKNPNTSHRIEGSNPMPKKQGFSRFNQLPVGHTYNSEGWIRFSGPWICFQHNCPASNLPRFKRPCPNRCPFEKVKFHAIPLRRWEVCSNKKSSKAGRWEGKGETGILNNQDVYGWKSIGSWFPTFTLGNGWKSPNVHLKLGV